MQQYTVNQYKQNKVNLHQLQNVPQDIVELYSNMEEEDEANICSSQYVNF